MSGNDRIYIIDDNENRCTKLRTIFDFIGQSTEVSKYRCMANNLRSKSKCYYSWCQANFEENYG